MSAPRRRLPPGERREQLLDAAIALAAGGDVAAVSVQDLAAVAGVSEGLLYHYFPTKQALVVAALRRAAEALVTDLRAAATVTTGAPLERLAAGLAAYLDHVQAQPTGWRAVLAGRTGELGEISAAVEEQSHALVLEAMGVEHPRAALLLALKGWSALERDACLTWLDHPELPRPVLEDLLLSTFLSALEAAARHDGQARDALARLSG